MAIDQTGNDDLACEVDHFRASRLFLRRCDLADRTVLDYNGTIRKQRSSLNINDMGVLKDGQHDELTVLIEEFSGTENCDVCAEAG